jgi:hypothetical protein
MDESTRKDDPKVLYHYTSVDAFKSIMQSQKMRATRYDQMNDHGELSFGICQLLSSMELRTVSNEDSDYFHYLLEGIRGFQDAQLPVYILSLSEAADSLEQWRAYAPVGGVAIGFDLEKVRKGFLIDITRKVGGHPLENPVRPNPGNRLLYCRYSRKDGTFSDPLTLTDQFFEQHSYPELFRRNESIAESLFMASLSTAVYRAIASIKHGAYEAEQEWRCVNIRPDPTDYPVKLNEKNRFFIELPFYAADYVTEVWVSPHGDSVGAKNAVAHFKSELQLDYEIKTSSIPYRT